jgi:Flp pilus assembly protein TadG
VVEFALVIPLFLLLVVGIFESGLVIKDYLTVSTAAREGARTAATGSMTAVVIDRVVASAPTVTVQRQNVILEKSTPGSGTWVALGNGPSQNDAVPGDYVKVTVRLPHNWIITGFVFISPITLTAQTVARRE